jgi:hypothetical protein
MKIMSKGYNQRRLAYGLLTRITPGISYTVSALEFSYRLDMANEHVMMLETINKYLLSYEF